MIRLHHPEGIRLRGPASNCRPHAPSCGHRPHRSRNRDHFARFRLSQQIIVVEPPPCRRIAAESAALECRIAAAARLNVDNPHFEHIARFGISHEDRAGADVNPEPLTCTTPVDRRIDGPGSTPLDILGVLCPKKDALGPRISLDHASVVVIRVVGQGLDSNKIFALDREHRLQRPAEITPVHCGCSSRDQIVVGVADSVERAVCHCHSRLLLLKPPYDTMTHHPLAAHSAGGSPPPRMRAAGSAQRLPDRT